MSFLSFRQTWSFQLISLCLVVTFMVSMVITPKSAYAQEGLLGLPQPGTMVNLSSSYVPLMITGLTVHPENPLLMDFIVSTGNSGLNAAQVKEQSDRLIKYFLACLTIPENNQWVNLSPYEKQRIVPEDLGQTVLGQDMLAQDYLLKQLTASLIYPEKNLGKNFWDKVYAKANEMYGTTQVPVNTFNKVWILPDTAKVYEHNNTVFVVKSHLTVMLDEDYLALTKHQSQPGDMFPRLSGGTCPQAGCQASDPLNLKAPQVNPQPTNTLASNIIRQIILPAIEQEVNTGKNFAQMRQIYNSMILAVWFKKNLKQALLNQVYTDKSKVNGVNADDPSIKEKIYKQYIEAYKKGVFNYIKEELFPPLDGEGRGGVNIPRKYFSGGLSPFDAAMLKPATTDEATAARSEEPLENQDFEVSGLTQEANGILTRNRDEAMVGIERLSPEQIMNRFNLAYSDALYLSVLIAKYLSDRVKPVLGKNDIASALLDQDARQSSFGMIDGKTLMDDQTNNEVAKNVHIKVLELKGGIGTNFKRLATLLRLTGRKTLADKGTDSYFENVPVQGFDVSGQTKIFNENISVAELKLLQYIHLARQKAFGEIEVQELVNSESEDAVSKFWDTVYLADRVDDRIPADKKRTYRQVFSQDHEKGIKGLRFNPDLIVQGVMPVINAETGEYLNNEALRAPGGHGACVALTMDKNARNDKDLTVPRITVFTNGDGVNNMLPPAVAGWMVREKAPIVMVTTTKQLLDLKGGLITLLSNTELPPNIQNKLARFESLSMEDMLELQNSLYPYLLEIAQAKAEGQQDIFLKMGITIGQKSAQFFNTNLHAQNHNILDPFLAELRNTIGDEKFYEIIGPDLIVNPKEKKVDGQTVNVIQLEGASGSALLAMNRFILTTTDPKVIALKAKYEIKRLVYFVNFDEKLRSEVFTPEKYTWDHYLYAFTNLFSVNPNNGRLVFTPGPGRNTLPGLELDTPYEDLEYDINAFGRLDVQGLDYLAIKGEVRIPNAILKGGVFIKNKSGKVMDLTTVNGFEHQDGRLVLNNVSVNIDQNGIVTTAPVTDLFAFVSNFGKVDAAMQTAIDNGTEDQRVPEKGAQTSGKAMRFNIFRPKVEEINYENPKSEDLKKAIIAPGRGWRSFMGNKSNVLEKYLLFDLLPPPQVGIGFVMDLNNGKEMDERLIKDLKDVLPSLINFLESEFRKKVMLENFEIEGSKVVGENHYTIAQITLTGNAQVANPESLNPTNGGIDLNSSHLRLQSEGQKVNITFDPAQIAQFRQGDFSGVRFQIIDVVPVNPMVLLGLTNTN